MSRRRGSWRRAGASLTLVAGLVLTGLVGSGCWDRQEIPATAFVTALAFDREGDQIRATAAILSPAGAGGGGGAGGIPGEPPNLSQSIILSAKGPSAAAAVSNIQTRSTRRLVLTHAQAVSVGEEVARRGLSGVIDFVSRSANFFRTSFLVVTPGRAAPLLAATLHQETDVGAALDNLGELAVNNPGTPIDNVGAFLRQVGQPGQEPLVARLISDRSEADILQLDGGGGGGGGEGGDGNGGGGGESGGNQAKGLTHLGLHGGAVFRGDRLLGFLDARSTAHVMVVKEKQRRVVYDLPCPACGRPLALQQTKVTSRIIPWLDPHGPRITVKLRVWVDVVDRPCNCPPRDTIKGIEAGLSRSLASGVAGTIRKVQSEFGSDIFGFGAELRRRHPAVWETMKDRWTTEFSLLPVIVLVDVKVTGPGLERGPAAMAR